MHHGVGCSCCVGSANIVGYRYSCAVCPTVPLCESCEALGRHDPSHARLKALAVRSAVACAPASYRARVQTFAPNHEQSSQPPVPVPSQWQWPQTGMTGMVHSFGMVHPTSGRTGAFGMQTFGPAASGTFGRQPTGEHVRKEHGPFVALQPPAPGGGAFGR